MTTTIARCFAMARRLATARRLTMMIVALALACAEARAGGLDLRVGGVNYDGDFGSDDRVALWAIPFQLVLNRPGSRLTVTVPYVGIDRVGNVTWSADGPLVLGVGGAGRPSYQGAPAGSSRRGLGDVVLNEELYLIKPGKGKTPLVGLVLEYKWATADEKNGLGTGKGDYGYGLDYLQPLGKVVQLQASGLYRNMGDPPGIDLRNGIKYSGGIGFVTSRSIWRLQYDSVPAYLEDAPVFNALGLPIGLEKVRDRQSVRVDYVRTSRRGGTTRLGVSHGLNDSSEDWGVMLMLSSGEQ